MQHLENLPLLSPIVSAISGSCLDPEVVYGYSERTDYGAASMHLMGGSSPAGRVAIRGRGATLDVNTNGEFSELIDLCSITENTILGVNDPWVRLRQIAYLASDRPHYVTIRLAAYATYRVAQRIQDHFEACGAGKYFLNLRECTGSGAVELALHAAWTAAAGNPTRRRLAVFRGGFHGSNLGGILASEHQAGQGSGRVLVDKVDNVDWFETPGVGVDGQLDAAAEQVLAMLESEGERYFAVLLEPIPWRNAVHVIPTEFLVRLRDVCSKNSICLIYDELQSGFGYAGRISFGEVSGVFPDIMVMGKGLTSGHGALALVAAREDFRVTRSPFGFKSNSGSMLSLVAVDAVLDRLVGVRHQGSNRLLDAVPAWLREELIDGLLPQRFVETSMALEAFISSIQESRPSLVGGSRGLGLMRGLMVLGADGVPSRDRARNVAREALAQGVHVRQASEAIFLKPCLNILAEELGEAASRLIRALDVAAS